MDSIEIEEKTIKIIKNICFREVGINEPLVSSKLLDSIIVVDLAVEIENEFGISIPFVDINEQHFETVKTICGYIELKVKAQ